MSIFNFGVSLVPLHFDIVLPSSYSLLRFSKHTLRFTSKEFMFSNDSFKVSLCCDLLCCMCYFVSLKNAQRSRNVVRTIHCSNLKTVC